MKKSLRIKLIGGIASVVTAAIIFVSGGGVAIAALLGGAGIITIPSFIHLNDKRNNKKDASYIEQIDDVQNKSGIIHNVETLKNNQVNTLSSKKTEQEPTQSIAPIKQYDDELIVQKLITVDALSQKEKALVRIRKKETEENLK